MFAKTCSMARKYGAKIVAAPAAAMASFATFAQESPGAGIVTKVAAGMSDGEKIGTLRQASVASQVRG